ncbi:MAG: hypothetical protein V3R84_09495 [Acidimicrobiia bacterium]
MTDNLVPPHGGTLVDLIVDPERADSTMEIILHLEYEGYIAGRSE